MMEEEITMMQGQYYFNWNFCSLSLCFCEELKVWQLNLHLDIAFAAKCLKAVNSNFVRNGWNITRTHPRHWLLWSRAGVSEQITYIVMAKGFTRLMTSTVLICIFWWCMAWHILYSKWPTLKQEKNYCMLVWCPDLKNYKSEEHRLQYFRRK